MAICADAWHPVPIYELFTRSPHTLYRLSTDSRLVVCQCVVVDLSSETDELP